MKIVKNGRLFGKLNIVDVLILLVVIAAVAFLAVRMVGGSGGETIAADEPSAQANLRYTVLCEDMPLMQAENAVTAVTAEDYELKLDDDSPLRSVRIRSSTATSSRMRRSPRRKFCRRTTAQTASA